MYKYRAAPARTATTDRAARAMTVRLRRKFMSEVPGRATLRTAIDPRTGPMGVQRKAAEGRAGRPARGSGEGVGDNMGRARGRSVVVAQKPSKLLGRVRFPSPAYGESPVFMRDLSDQA